MNRSFRDYIATVAAIASAIACTFSWGLYRDTERKAITAQVGLDRSLYAIQVWANANNQPSLSATIGQCRDDFQALAELR